ncbi:MAG: hypothetical protein AVDCRST_MAG87-2252, partial [uncultured Thermomicrobiales bacterium]
APPRSRSREQPSDRMSGVPRVVPDFVPDRPDWRRRPRFRVRSTGRGGRARRPWRGAEDGRRGFRQHRLARGTGRCCRPRGDRDPRGARLVGAVRERDHRPSGV